MAQQQIITKPYVEELQDNDSLFINHDGALRQIKKSDADFASGADMRAEVAAREAFEDQEVAAREAFKKSETEARVQFETSVEGQITEKANVDGYYEEMTVGDAEQLVATQFVEDNEPYLFRPTGGSSDVGNRAYFDKIVGGTVAWNQLVKQRESPLTANGVTSTYNTDGTVTLSGTITRSYAETYNSISLVANHVYIFSSTILANPNNVSFAIKPLNIPSTGSAAKNTSNSSRTNYGITNVTIGTDLTGIKFKSNFFDLTQMFGSTIADYIYSLEQSQAGAGVAWFKKLFPKDYYVYNAGELLSVEGIQSHDTVGFNQWDEEWEVGVFNNNGEPYGVATNAIRSKTFCKCVPNTTYYRRSSKTESEYYIQMFYYDADKNFISRAYENSRTFTTPQNAHYFKICTQTNLYVYGGTYLNDICINLSDPSRNGEYEPYEKHSYPLDSSLTLRGIPKLDASNNLYYDGDEYKADGTVTRKYGVYTIQASNVSLNNNAYTNISYAEIVNLPNMLRSMYKQCVHSKFGVGKHGYPFDDASHVGELLVNSAVDGFWFGFAKGTTEEQMKSALDGTTIVYELATPTTETAKPFQHIQIVDDFGTEEFVSTGIVPVGHKTRYPANLRDKLQHLPSLASADGTYLIQQSGKQMSLIHMPAVFPDTPTEDGTYTLKTVVTGGVATLKWVVE